MSPNGPLLATDRRIILVGVDADESDVVLHLAAEYAQALTAALVFVVVDEGRYPVGHTADGDVVALPTDSDAVDEIVEEFPAALRDRIHGMLDGTDVPWSTRAMAGGAAQQLIGVAEEIDARLIIVGSRRPGAWGSLRDFLNGSIAARLAHRQHRPVLIVPLTPVSDDAELPWNDHD